MMIALYIFGGLFFYFIVGILIAAQFREGTDNDKLTVIMAIWPIVAFALVCMLANEFFKAVILKVGKTQDKIIEKITGFKEVRKDEDDEHE